MGSIGEEELDQMVRDYIESADSPSSTSVSSSIPSSLHHRRGQSTYLTLQEVLGKQTDEEVEIHEKVSLYVKNMGIGGDQIGNQKKFLMMKLEMDGYEASLCKTTWNSTFSCSKENYEFIEVSIMETKNGGKPMRLIVDIEFRSQFEMARPTGKYKELVNTLPSIFVGAEEKVKEIISLLCSAGKKSLKEKGLYIPPWRRASYMQSKWLSTNCKKVTFSSKKEFDIDQTEEKSTSTCCPFIFM